MKKTFLTLVAVGFGASVAFAQTTTLDPEQEEVQMEEQTDTMYEQEEQDGKKVVQMYEVPVAVQDAFKNGQYKDYEVLTIYEVPEEVQMAEAVDTEVQGVIYEFEVAQAGEAATEPALGTEEDGMEGIETQRVSERQPDLVLFFDASGEVIKEEAPVEQEDEIEE